MYPRTNYEMTQADLDALLDACKPVPYMVIGGRAPASPQENANRAWARLGEKMGFDPMSVQPVSGQSNRFFTAVPNETETQRIERLAREADGAKRARMVELEGNIAAAQAELASLTDAQ